MFRKESETSTRRRFVKAAGISSVGFAAGLAGCTGGGGGGGGDGADGGGGDGGDGGGGDGGGGDGGDGGGGTPATTAAQELTELNITMAPSGFQGIIMDHIVSDTNILANELESRGYAGNLQKSWEGAALFASGGPDFSTMSTHEATRLGVERSMDLVCVAKLAPLFMGWWVSKGGPYDMEDDQAAVDKIVDGQAPVAVGSWAGGDIPGYSMVANEAYGYDFSQENSDFRIVTADYGSIPQLIVNGEAATGGTSPVHGIARELDDTGEPTLRPLFIAGRRLEELGFGVPPVNNWTTTQEFWDNHAEGVKGFMTAYAKGNQWWFEAPMERIRSDQQAHLEQLFLDNMTQAEFLIKWGITNELEGGYPIIYSDIELTDEYIQQDRSYLEKAHSAGFVPDGWQDRLSYQQVSLPN